MEIIGLANIFSCSHFILPDINQTIIIPLNQSQLFTEAIFIDDDKIVARADIIISLTVNIQCLKSGSHQDTLSIWLRINDIDLAYSIHRTSLTINNDHKVLSFSLNILLKKNDYLQFLISNLNGQLGIGSNLDSSIDSSVLSAILIIYEQCHDDNLIKWSDSF